VAERASILIVGGGIIGSGIAWALAERGLDGVVVVDLDLAGIYASSELNAGGARATWWQPVNVETCRLTLDFFRAHAAELGFREAGYLWLYQDRALWDQALERSAMQAAHGLRVEALAVDELARRFPLVDRALDELVGATFSPRDGLVNPNAVRALYRREAERRGVRFLNRHYVAGVETVLAAGAGGALRRVAAAIALELRRVDPADEDGVLRSFLTHHHVSAAHVVAEHRIECDAVVNALGAWSPVFSAKIGVRDVTEPVRRQIALVDVHASDLPAGVQLADAGMIVDASGLYFHPEGAHVLAGYSIPNEPPGFEFRYDGDAFFETEIWPRLAHRASAFERCRHVRGWAGLYAVTPDRSGVAGAVDGIANLYEAHSFTGRGVMQSWAIARGMAALIATGRFAEIDLAPLTRARFDDPARWVREPLHI
jgi:FAD-dependent oxidoreductase domain-containing protein 1